MLLITADRLRLDKPSRMSTSGSVANFSIYGIWNATQLIFATGMQNWIWPVA